MSIRRLRLFLDANILHGAAIRDFLLRLAEAGLIEVYWSEPVLEETRRSLERRGLPAEKVDRLVSTLRTAFPHSEVQNFEALVSEMDCPDPDDRHVLAAAVDAEADFLVTQNVGDFPSDTWERHDVTVITGDEAAAFFVQAYPETAVEVGRAQIADLVNPPSSEDDFLRAVARTAPRFAIALGTVFGLEAWAKLQADVDDATAERSPQDAVGSLLAVLSDGSDDEIWERLHPEYQAAALTGGGRRNAIQSLRHHLADVTAEGWGFGSAKRIHAPDTELVKLVRLDETGPIVHSPTLVQHAHLFRMIHVDGAWLLAGLDEPEPSLQPDPSPPPVP